MNIHDYRWLISEQTALNRMLAQTPESAVLSRMSLNDRLQEVETELKNYIGYSPQLIDASLTFGGEPVVGSRGIYADFGSKAISAFSKAVSLVGASRYGPLGPRGPVSHSEDYQLIITGTALGSYGFQVEAASQRPVPEGKATPVEFAITRVKQILEASLATDEELTDTIKEIDKRALMGVHDFLKTVADNKAVCALAFQGDVFRFRDVDQVRRSQNRLSHDNIKEANVTVAVGVLGFFPHSPRVQLEIRGGEDEFWGGEFGRIIEARVDPAIAHPPNFNDLVGQEVNVNARTRQVGSGQLSYIITQLLNLS